MPRYRIGEVSIDTDNVEIVGPDGVRDIEPQVFAVITYLLEQPGRLVTKEELLDNVWGDRFVSESALTTRIKQARRALGDDGRTQWAIKTVHGRGYRFVADREVVDHRTTTNEAHRAVILGPVPLPDGLQADTRQVFVGRAAELAQAVRVLSRLADDRSFGWIWVLGEPGIGKTRLAAEVAREAQQRGHRVWFGRNNEDLKVPHQPFLEVIRSAIEQVEPAGRAEFVARMPPDLGPLLPGDYPSPNAPNAVVGTTHSDARRYRLFEAVAGWLIDAAADAPLTVIIDDAHWAADSTLQLLAHLQQRLDGASVTFVVTARDTAPDINSRVVDLLAAGQGMANTALIRLTGLSDADAVRFVGETTELEEVMRQTAGNPLLLQAVNPADGAVDIQIAVHRRLSSLDADVQETLRVASILGLEFEVRVAAAATRRGELDLLDHLEQAVAARLLDDVGVDRFRFRHALIRSSLRDDLSSARQARVHKQIADAILELFGNQREHLPALAFHTAEAVAADPSLRPVAVERLELAAHESMNQLSFEEAAASFGRALDLTAPDNATLRARLALQQGIAETRAGSSMTAVRTFEHAVSLARLSGDTRLRIETALRYEDATWRPGLSGVQALAHLAEATRVLDEATAAEHAIDDETELRARLAIGRLRALALSGQVEKAEAEFETTRELARQVGSATLEARALTVYLSQVRFLQGLDGTQVLVDRLAELQPAIDNGDVALHAVHVRSLHAALAGNFDQTRDLADLMAQLQEESHSSFWKFIRTNQEAMEAFYSGDLIAAERLADECLTLADELPEEDGSGTYGLRMFMIRREQDRLASIAPLVRHVLSEGDVEGVWTPGLALLLVETGSAHEAEDVLSEIKAASFELPLDAMWSTVMTFLIETVVQLGDREACAILRAKFTRLAGTNVTTGSGLLSFGRADRLLGMLSLTMGELDTAEKHLGLALEADSAGGSILWANASRLWLSRVRRAQGHAPEADAMLAVVAQQAHDAGLARLERLATTELR